MKARFGAFVVPALIASSAPAAAEPANDWYVAAGGSLSLLKDSHTRVLNLPIPAGFSESRNRMSAGEGFQLAAGRRFGDVRMEVEGGYSRNKSSSYLAIVPPTGRIPSQGGHKTWRLMANGYYDFGDGPLRPYVGAGLGYADVKARLFAARAPFPKETPFLILNDHKGGFAYQAMIGSAFEIATGVELTGQYRWFSAGKVHLWDRAGFEHVRQHRGHNIDVGIRVGF